jgi:hypothetical protein
MMLVPDSQGDDLEANEIQQENKLVSATLDIKGNEDINKQEIPEFRTLNNCIAQLNLPIPQRHCICHLN